MSAQFLAALRQAETGGAPDGYARVGEVVRGTERRLGAYGIASDDWPHMAAYAGLEGASWRDPRAQDAVVATIVQRLYDKYQDWRLVAVAWRAGEEVADAVAADPSLLTQERLSPVAEYASQLMTYAKTASGLSQTAPRDQVMAYDPDLETIPVSEELRPTTRAEDVLRRRLYAMRERIKAQPAHDEGPGEMEPDNDVDDLRKSGGE